MLRLLYGKEFLDLFRDRRTIFTMMVMPMLMMPISMVGTNYVMNKTRSDAKAQRFRIALQGPADVAAGLRGAGFEVQPSSDPRGEAQSKKVEAGVAVTGTGPVSQVNVYSDESDLVKSQVLRGRIRDVFEKLRDVRLHAAMQKAGIPAELANPYNIETVNLAQPRKMAGSFIGGLIAFMLIIFLMNGAMYGAVDMTAGEKERRTMEILLSSGAHRTEIVVGKVLMAATMSLLTAGLSLASLLLSFQVLTRMDRQARSVFSLNLDAGSAVLLLVSIVPFVIMVAAFGIALATPARSTREGMSYLTPVFFIAMALSAPAYLPSFENKALLAMVPVANFMQSFKHLLAGEWSWGPYLLQLAVNFAVAALAVGIAVRKFGDEKILLRV